MTSIDVDHRISEVRRTVGTRTLEAGETRVVSLSRVYPTDPADLWDACTNPERLPRWFLPVSGDLRVGGRYSLEGNADGTIQECEPPRRFFATWEFGGNVSWIEVQVTEEGDGRSRFTLEHLSLVTDDDESWAQFGPGAAGVGWDLGLLGLGLHLESGGKPVDPAEAQQWALSDAGQRFVVGVSDSWRAASVEAGTDPVEAEAAAQHTTAFYTGAGEEG